MPIYEYYCPKCAAKFERLRPMTRADDARADDARANESATCTKGHGGAARTLSVFAGVARNADGSLDMAPSSGGCGCGGGGCGCGR